MRTVVRGAVGSALVILTQLAPSTSAAYPFMIRHGYTGCAECHTDPSGGGTLTEYGRGQGVILLASQYRPHAEDWEPPASKDFLFGALPLPQQVALQADIRALLVPKPGDMRFIVMQSDLEGSVDLGVFRAEASAGWVSEGAERAWITTNSAQGGNLVSRVHWLGLEPAKDVLVRAGSMNLPFGIRTEQHILMARSATGTDTNDGQEFGLDVALQRGELRAEVMGIAGDFQVSPDDYRKRGYSALLGWGPENNVEVGLSSLLTHAALDEVTRAPATRQAHELFGRWSPTGVLAFLGEAGLTTLGDGSTTSIGTVGYLQADLEPVQGVHVQGTGEWCDDDLSDEAAAVGRGWLALQWFAVSHFDLRVDGLYGTLYCSPGTEASFMGLVQAHTYL